jgi:hypothetical protein
MPSTKTVFWGIILSSMLTPWLVGLTIKAQLMAKGESTVPIVYFIGSAIPISVWWSIPFIALAIVARISLNKPGISKKDRKSRLTVIMLAHGFGLGGMVPVFREVFIVWDVVWLIIPIQLVYGGAIIVGAAIGWLFTKASALR